MAYTKPLPAIDNWNRGFWAAAREQRLAAPQCSDCGHTFFPPGACCPKCLSQKFTWRNLSGRGKVESWTVFHQLYYKGFADDLPYNVAVIRLDEGISLMSNVTGIANRDLRAGMEVQVVFEQATDEITIPKFRPVSASGG
jgi:uncharacterized OB-fold protein